MTNMIIVILILSVLITIYSRYQTKANIKKLNEMKREFESDKYKED